MLSEKKDINSTNSSLWKRIQNIYSSKSSKKISSPEEYLLQAQNLFKQSKWNDAFNAATLAIQIAPSYAEAYLLLARVHAANKDLESAIKSSERAIMEAPHYAEAHLVLGQYLHAKGLNQNSISMAKKAIELNPGYLEAHLFLGQIFYYLYQLDQSISWLKSALSINTKCIEAKNLLAMIFEEQGLFDQAETLYSEAIAINPLYAEAHYNLGFLFRKTGRSVEAAATFKVAHSLFNPHLLLTEPVNSVSRYLNLRKRYFLFFRNILLWKLTGKLSDNKWLNHQMLYHATNSVSNDYVSYYLRKLQKIKIKKNIPWRNSVFFPWVKQNDISEITTTLERDGIYVFHNLIEDRLLDKIYNFSTTQKANLSPPLPYNKDQHVFQPNSTPLSHGYFFEEKELLNNPIFQKFAADPLLLSIAQAYFGVNPKFREISLWWSTNFSRVPSSYMAQLYHIDLSRLTSFQWLICFVYLTDVTIENGAHSYVIGTHKADDEGKKLRNRGVVRISDEEIYSTYGKERVLDITGPRGTVFIADTRGFHKGHHVKKGNRLMMQSCLVNSLYPKCKNETWGISPKDATFLETSKLHPEFFSGYTLHI